MFERAVAACVIVLAGCYVARYVAVDFFHSDTLRNYLVRYLLKYAPLLTKWAAGVKII